MKVLLINFDGQIISGISEAFANDLVEKVDSASPEHIAEDVRQFIETWVPDLLVISEASFPAGRSRSACVMEELRTGKLLKQPAIFVGNAQDKRAIELLQSGIQATIPVTIDSKTTTQSVNSELLRLQAITLTNLSKGQATKDFRLGQITVMPETNEIYIFGQKIRLTTHEANLFVPLILAKGRTVTKDALYSQLYSFDSDVVPKIIDVYVCKGRKKLDDFLKLFGYDGVGLIATVWGQGYAIDLKKVPGLEGERARSDLLLGDQSTETQAQLPAPSLAITDQSGGRGKISFKGQTREKGLHPDERPLARVSHNTSDILTRIRDHLLVADFQERDSDIKHYISLAGQAQREGHSTQELFGLFAGCFKPVWQRGGVLDLKTFEYHLTNPERLRFYRIDHDAVNAVPTSPSDAAIVEAPTRGGDTRAAVLPSRAP